MTNFSPRWEHFWVAKPFIGAPCHSIYNDRLETPCFLAQLLPKRKAIQQLLNWALWNPGLLVVLSPSQKKHNTLNGRCRYYVPTICFITLFFGCSKFFHTEQNDRLGGGNSNIFYVHPYSGKMNPFWRAYFSNGLVQPPTSRGFRIPMFLDRHLCAWQRKMIETWKWCNSCTLVLWMVGGVGCHVGTMSGDFLFKKTNLGVVV